MELTYPKNSTSTFKTLTSGMLKEKVYVSKYQKYGLYRNFTTLLTHDGNPIVFTGSAENGVREVVFAFDLHDSNFPMLIDYLILIGQKEKLAMATHIVHCTLVIFPIPRANVIYLIIRV